jgi:hypothetical protein
MVTVGEARKGKRKQGSKANAMTQAKQTGQRAKTAKKEGQRPKEGSVVESSAQFVGPWLEEADED